MMAGDNPPVGILLCTDKGSQMVEYALSGNGQSIICFNIYVTFAR